MDSKLKFKLQMIFLWHEHVILTRKVIEGFVHKHKDLEMRKKMLLANQDSIGDLIKPYYGDLAGNALAGLLKEHIRIADRIVIAAIAGNTKETAKQIKNWHSNAEQIAEFLSKANPYFSFKGTRSMMYKHLYLTLKEAVAEIKGEKSTYDWYYKALKQAAMMGKDLAEGIIKHKF